MVLRLALAQKVGLGTPDHALVATALAAGRRRPAPIGAWRPRHAASARPAGDGRAAAARPTVEERWRAAWGEEAVEAARRQIAKRPPLDLTFADDAEAQDYAPTNGGVSLAPRPRSARKRVGRRTAGLRRGPMVGAGPRRVASGAPDPAGANDVLDLCAAPGGKTMQLAAAGHRVTAVDSSESRLGRLRENLERTHLAAQLVTADALKWKPERQFDAILLDAPCSATGTFRRHPEVLYRARPQVIADSAELQSQLARSGCAMAEARRRAGLFGLLARTAGRRGGRRGISRPPMPTSNSTARSRRFAGLRDRARRQAGSESCPACSKPKAGSTASSWRALSAAG